MFWLFFLVLVFYLVYYILNSNYRYWQKRGVAGPPPKFLVGNLGQALLLKKEAGEVYTEIYNDYKEASVVGLYRAFTPLLLIRDPEIIKDITIKNFANFHDNDFNIDKKTDPIYGRNPFFLRGEEWKLVRSQLSPGFTSGKMKWIYPHLEENAEAMVQFIVEKATPEAYEAKELSTRFTLNNVASCAFGLDGKCFDEDCSEFRQLAKDFFSPGGWTLFVIFLTTTFPTISNWLSSSFVSKKLEKKLINLVSQTLKYRETNNIVRNDFLHIMNELKKTCKEYDFTIMDITAHAAGFFGDGFETSSCVMSFVLYFLSRNPEVQSLLRGEIVEAFANNNGTIPYEVMQNLPYLDAVINESLRNQPPVFYMQKLCTKDYHDSSRSLNIEKGTSIILPMHGIQNDPKFFDEPEVFRPERFLGENKDKIQKCTFFPFGEGPRACLGQRFGVLQIKAGVAYIVKNYEMSLNKKTKLPLKLEPTNFITTPIGGLWIDFTKNK